MRPDRFRDGGSSHFPGARHRFRRSLLLRLLLVLLATGLIVNCSVGAFFRLCFGHDAHAAMESNVIRYARYLSGEIGSPPDTALARRLARDHSLLIRYDGPGLYWATSPDLPSRPRMHGDTLGPGEAGWYRGRLFVRVDEGDGRFLIATDFHRMAYGRWEYVVLLLLVLSLVLGAAFLAIRRLLSPLKGLTRAVERMGDGELGHQVPVCGRDELGRLAHSFNAMSTRQAQLVRSREQLLLDVSHELRSPLTRIKVALEMTPDGATKESIRDDLGEMEAMIGEILEAARLDSAHGRLNLEEADLSELVEECFQGLRGRPPGLRWQAGRPEGARGPVVKVDRERMRKVLANVLDNALKYSQESARPVEASVEEDGSTVTLRIRDHGQGIPGEELPRLFEPFYRVDRSRSRDTGGYGLGLSLCKRIMEAHGGRIAISSQMGLGTEVALVFPKD